MKAFSIFIAAALLCFLFISCNNKDNSNSPCNNDGTICFNNKTDSAVVVTIKEAPAQFSVESNYLKCVSIKGNVLYSINFTGKNLYKDTSFVLQVCDKKNIVIVRWQPPPPYQFLPEQIDPLRALIINRLKWSNNIGREWSKPPVFPPVTLRNS